MRSDSKVGEAGSWASESILSVDVMVVVVPASLPANALCVRDLLEEPAPPAADRADGSSAGGPWAAERRRGTGDPHCRHE
jgi:hypothetical protein